MFLASDSGCQHGLVVTVESALRNSSDGFRAEIHIGDCGLDPETRRSMEEVWTRHPKVAGVRFHKLDLDDFHGFMSSGLHPAALARLQMPELMPEAGRAIYLDTDLLVLGDLSELARIDLQGLPVGGATEGYFKTLREAGYRLSEIPVEVEPDAPYFNSGVLVADLGLWRQARVWEKSKSLITSHFDKFTHNDQSVLNLLFSGRSLVLAPKWNRQRQVYDDLPLVVPRDAGIIHFIGPVKPWHYSKRSGCGAVSLWQEQLARTEVHLPPLSPRRHYQGALPLLWARKAAKLASARLARILSR